MKADKSANGRTKVTNSSATGSATTTNATSIGYWAAQEQYSMHDLLKFVVQAEKGGFNSTMTSDHFHPWWHDNGYGNFTWAWIPAAAERTKKMKFVTGVTAPIYRYHPAIVAQAFASLDVLYPGRIGLGLGTGEAMNEVPLGYDWPKSSKVRLTRTVETIQIIRKLWNQERKSKRYYRDKRNRNSNDYDNSSRYRNAAEEGFIDFNGEYFLIRQAKLYTPPVSKHIPIYLAVTGPQSVKAAARFADGFITFLKPSESSSVLDTINASTIMEDRDPSSFEKMAEYKLSFSEDYDKAFESTKFWRATLIKNIFSSNVSDPRQLQKKAERQVTDEQLKQSIDIITSVEDCMKRIEEYFKSGFTKVYIHSTSPDETYFVRSFSKKVLPYFSER
ncbi:MAG TPA: LLM class flavin-dependent oxidoreductase [Candidatus Acidoferrum sp.]|nr:LLM class flavin-dependent oxidoreductase [Candidatus Acidoferrum sp.]